MSLIYDEGIIISTRFKIETALKERNAFDPNTAADVKEAKIDFKEILTIMEKSGLIDRTFDGRIYMTPKGQEQQVKGFTVSQTNNMPSGSRRLIRFSRNK